MRTAKVLLLVALAICMFGAIAFTWGIDAAIHRGAVESFDIGVMPSGEVYAAVVGTADQFGGRGGVYIYRSIDQGRSWNLVTEFATESLSNVRLVVGEHEDLGLEMVHLFFAEDTQDRVLVRTLAVGPDGRLDGFADRTFGGSTPRRSFEVVRSYRPVHSIPESDVIRYAIVAAQYVPVLREIHVFTSTDFGNRWEQVLTVSDIAYGHLDEPEIALTWGAGQFLLVYPKELEDAEHWYDYSVYGVGSINGTAWETSRAGEWKVEDASSSMAVPRFFMYPHICAAREPSTAERTAWIVLDTRDSVRDTFTLEMWYWKMPPWAPAAPDWEHPWARQPIAGPTSDGLVYSCLDVSSPVSLGDPTVYMLFDWEGALKLYQGSPSHPVALSIAGTAMNDHRYYLAHDAQLRPRIVHYPALPGAPSCVGIAYTSPPVAPTGRFDFEGVDLYYDSSCVTSIVPHTTEPTEEWRGGILAPYEDQLEGRFGVAVSTVCASSHSHEIEVAWLPSDSDLVDITVQVDGPDGPLAKFESPDVSSGVILHVNLPEGGIVTVTVSAIDTAGSSSFSESRSVLLDPC